MLNGSSLAGWLFRRHLGLILLALAAVALLAASGRDMPWRALTLGGALTVAAAALLAVRGGRRLTAPWEEVARRARSLAAGDFSTELRLPSFEEADAAAAAINRMGGQLGGEIEELKHQVTERETLLASMVESVIAVDGDGRILRMNRAASRLLGVPSEPAEGRLLQEVARHSSLARFLQRALADSEVIEEEVLIPGEPERYWHARGTRLPMREDGRPGALIVLQDITRLRRLESLRREFVANVSHELKTPITSIQGFVETLRSEPELGTDDARSFLDIILRHTHRLNDIVEDLLALSRLEQQSEREELAVEVVPLDELIASVLQSFAPRAAERDMILESEVPENLPVRVNPRLLEQALGNLIDNAVKYAEGSKRVEVRAEARPDGLRLTVRDEGPGIESQHWERLFERFYRVDPGRSRKLGGTGLGLAIVKHIALAHGGSVGVESEPGRGTRFWIHLPRALDI